MILTALDRRPSILRRRILSRFSRIFAVSVTQSTRRTTDGKCLDAKSTDVCPPSSKRTMRINLDKASPRFAHRYILGRKYYSPVAFSNGNFPGRLIRNNDCVCLPSGIIKNLTGRLRPAVARVRERERETPVARESTLKLIFQLSFRGDIKRDLCVSEVKQ